MKFIIPRKKKNKHSNPKLHSLHLPSPRGTYNDCEKGKGFMA